MKKLYVSVLWLLLGAGTALAQCNGFIFKIKEGKLAKHDNNGNYRGSITNDVSDFDCNPEYVLVVKTNGKLMKYDFNGNYRGSVTGDVSRVRVSGEMLVVTKTNGKTCKYDFNGNYRGSI